MFQNFFKIALRNLVKSKIYSFINIAGLSIGIASYLLILLFVRHELSYDRFNQYFDRIYRVGLKFYVGSDRVDLAQGPVPVGPTLVQDFPEVEIFTRLFYEGYRDQSVYVRHGDRQFREERFLWADSSVFDVFTIALLEGDPKNALREPNSVVIIPTVAEKYFGQTAPLGKMLTLHDGTVYQVTGIARPLPENAHFHFDFLAAYASHPQSQNPEWYDIVNFTYIRLRKDADPARLEAQFPEFSRKYVGPIIPLAIGVSYDQFLEAGNEFGFFLQPLKDIHLHSELSNEIEPSGNFQTVVIFGAIACLILIVASINFINLATARSTQRAIEVGVRKAIGSSRGQLVLQFLTESVFLSLISILLALLLVDLFLPVFNQLVGKQLSLSFVRHLAFFPGLLLAALVIGCFAGLYPALFLASFKPVVALRGRLKASAKGQRFRNGLVIFQFATSIILIVGTLVIYNQLHFIRNRKLGFDQDQLVVLKEARRLGTRQQAFKSELLRNPYLVSATFTDCLPQMMLEVKNFTKENSPDNETFNMITITADYDFGETYHFELAQGRYFNTRFSTDSAAVVLNETAVCALNLQNALEERLILARRKPRTLKIVGVFRDFHVQPLHRKIRPVAIILGEKAPFALLSVRIRGGQIPAALQFIEEKWRKFVPEQPPDYAFFDETFQRDYQAEIQSGKVVTAFAVLAIFIACLGLLGLASFATTQRTKEIGVRKVLGASVSGIVLLLFRDFLKWVVLANLISWPVAFWLMQRWLQNFAYRIHLDWRTFIFAGGLSVLIALLTISYQAILAANANPVKSLRVE